MRALITGITGQDGHFLSKLLLEKGYEVHGLVRRNSQQSLGSLASLPHDTLKQIHIHWADITDHTVVGHILRTEQYGELYHLAAQSSVDVSFTNPLLTFAINFDGTINIVNAIKEFSPQTKMYFAATSEMFGKAEEAPQHETTCFHPRNPYAVSKLAGFWMIRNYREAYALFLSNGILFNHESELRGGEFLTRKVSKAVARIYKGSREILEVGNMDSKKDWGFAGDYVRAMWLMLQHPRPDDFVVASGEGHTVREFIEKAFSVAGREIVWEGEGVKEEGKDKKTGRVMVKVNPQFFRPIDTKDLVGDCTKARTVLGWTRELTFSQLVLRMVQYDIDTIR